MDIKEKIEQSVKKLKNNPASKEGIVRGFKG